MSDEEFEKQKNNCMEQLIRQWDNIKSESNFYWTKIKSKSLEFDFHKNSKSRMSKITKSDFINFY